ncbi:MAG: type IV secretion system DNA-binding domain-containing protein [Elusimicrobia bacterium]|nr:type IV secretion system DNA-binding domain-containing protein [Elusimicrobiota bacterium]
MIKIIVYYTSLPDIAKFMILILSAFFVYHFFVFYLWKPPKKKLFFWQFAVYFSILILGFYILKNFYYTSYKTVFETIYMERIINMFWKPFLNDTIYAPLLVVVTVIFKTFFLYKLNPKTLKHGPVFIPTGDTNGIKVGNFSRDVLPEHIREFAKHSTKPLILPFNRLSRGVTILGDMGSGKSRLMKAIHDGIREKYPKIPILIHDPKGEWLRTLYNPDTDIIFAPYDTRSIGWKMWEDFKIHPELKYSVISTAVESHHSGNTTDRFWSDSAIVLLKDAATFDTIDETKMWLIKKREKAGDDKAFQGKYATALIGFRDIVTIELLAQNTPGGKRIDDLLQHPGRIFLLNNATSSAEQHGSLALMLSAFLLRAISLPDVSEDELRAAVFIDEALTFHLPADIERSVYNQSRSKGLSIIASGQRLPDKTHGEQGAWANQAAHIFGMRTSSMETRTSLSQRLGNMMYDEKQESVSQGENNSSKTSSDIQRQHAALAPEDFGKLKNREFILFHENGVAPGRVIEVPMNQIDSIQTSCYNKRNDVAEFMRELE